MEERYSLITPQAFANPYEVYDRMREEVPVYWVPMFNSWFLTRYDDVQTLLYDERVRASNAHNKIISTMSTEQQGKFESIDSFLARWLVFLDPPDHTRLRRLLNHSFRPQSIGEMSGYIQKLVDELIDDLVASGPEVDFITQFAYPLPVLVICEMLGLPEEGRNLFKGWAQVIGMFFAMDQTTEYSDHTDMMHQAVKEIHDYTYKLLAERRRNPQDDMLTRLIEAELDGEKLSDDEITASWIFLLFAGHDTTQNLLGNGLKALLSAPAQYEQLKQNPNLVEGAIEEFLRYDSPNQFVTRDPVVDIEIGGQIVKVGQKLFLGTGAANRDPAQFENPHQLNITRAHNPHITFGHGLHFCLGAPLARLEGRIAFTTILRRLPSLQLAEEPPIWRPSFTLRGLGKLPLSLS